MAMESVITTSMDMYFSVLVNVIQVRLIKNRQTYKLEESFGSVVECLMRDRGAMGSRQTRVTALCP